MWWFPLPLVLLTSESAKLVLLHTCTLPQTGLSARRRKKEPAQEQEERPQEDAVTGIINLLRCPSKMILCADAGMICIPDATRSKHRVLVPWVPVPSQDHN